MVLRMFGPGVGTAMSNRGNFAITAFASAFTLALLAASRAAFAGQMPVLAHRLE